MSDEYQPESPVFTSDTPNLTGSIASLTGQESVSGMPSDSDYKFVTGPDGQMYAVQKEPFVWKKFFIGLGVPMFLMIFPLILSFAVESMFPDWDDAYEYDEIDLELVNGTEYATNYTLDSEQNIEWCDVRDRNWDDSVWYYCEASSSASEMQIYENTRHEIELIRGNETAYYANFSIESDTKLEDCYVPAHDGWYYCKLTSDGFRIMKESWDHQKDRHTTYQVGSWNETTGVINLDDDEDFGFSIEMEITTAKQVGFWSQMDGVFHFDDGKDHGAEIEIYVETIDNEVQQQMDESDSLVSALFSISTIMCLAAPLVSIGMMAYGFAATGGKAMGIGATVAIVSYPVIAFFGCIAMFAAGGH